MGLKLKMFALALAVFFMYSISTTGVKAEEGGAGQQPPPDTGNPGAVKANETITTEAPPTKCEDGQFCDTRGCVNVKEFIAAEKKKPEYKENVKNQKDLNKLAEDNFKNRKDALAQHCKTGKCELQDIDGWKMAVCKGTRTMAAGTLLIVTLLAYYIF